MTAQRGWGMGRDPDDQNQVQSSRRQILRGLFVGAAATTVVLPAAWTSPLVRSVVVPAHAQASPRKGEGDEKKDAKKDDDGGDDGKKKKKKQMSTTPPPTTPACDEHPGTPWGECRTEDGQCGCNGPGFCDTSFPGSCGG